MDTVVNDSQINSDVANAMMADIKAEVAQVVQDGDIVNGGKITNIINETINKTKTQGIHYTIVNLLRLNKHYIMNGNT